MADSKHSRLKIHCGQAESPSASVGSAAWLSLLGKRLSAATGYPVSFRSPEEINALQPLWSAPLDAGPGGATGLLAIDEQVDEGGTDSAGGALEIQDLTHLIADLINEFGQARRSIGEREAELAAGVPVVRRPDEQLHLADRLEAVLKGGAEAIGCQAAGLYLLDPATTELKLRASYGLPSACLLEPARPLRGAVADLEALTGHAVVLEDDLLHPYWKVPQACGAAVCVPVATPSTILGTIWVYSDTPREFTDQQTNQIEIIAGRLASDLEREMLMHQSAATDALRREIEQAEDLQESQQPSVQPPIENIDVAGWTRRANALGGAFYDWSVLPDGVLALAVGDALEGGPAAAIVAAAVRATLWSHADYLSQPGAILGRVSHTLWSTSLGDQFASLLLAMIDPASGELRIATAGRAAAILVGKTGSQFIAQESLPLGLEPDIEYPVAKRNFSPGDALLLYTDGLYAAQNAHGEMLAESQLISALQSKHHRRAASVTATVSQLLDQGGIYHLPTDIAVLSAVHK